MNNYDRQQQTTTTAIMSPDWGKEYIECELTSFKSFCLNKMKT